MSIHSESKPVFKVCPFIFVISDFIGTFSFVLDKVIHKEDVYNYINVSMDMYDHCKICDFKRIHLVNGIQRFKKDYTNPGHKGLGI